MFVFFLFGFPFGTEAFEAFSGIGICGEYTHTHGWQGIPKSLGVIYTHGFSTH